MADDLIERAEYALASWNTIPAFKNTYVTELVGELITELKAAYAKCDQNLVDFIKNYAHMTTQLTEAPDRSFIDDRGHHWEWCGGEEGTWAWRRTSAGD